MQVTIELPENLAKLLGNDAANVERAILETVVAAAVRDGSITAAQARQCLNLSRYETDGLLKRYHAGFEMTLDELERDTALAFSAAN
jgi:hypothetical protein